MALTQLLFETCIYGRIYPQAAKDIFSFSFVCLLIASVCIAAAGYAINDYFDQNIDQVNKPNKVVVNRIISRRWVIFWHLFLSLVGLFCTVLALPLPSFWHLVLGNFVAVMALWFYSTDLKKKLLVGNVLISLLTAWVLLVLFFAKHPLHLDQWLRVEHQEVRFFRLAFLYAGFAFVISLIREVIKDMEDIEGDRRYGCRTMPIVWGLNASKVFVAVWIVVLVASLLLLQVYALGLGWWISAVYCVVLMVLPLLWVLRQLFVAQVAKDFHQLSSVIKWCMFAGILSMLFFRLYP